MHHCIKGDIIWGLRNRNKGGKHAHFIIFLEEHPTDANLFIGAMLTHSASYGNIKLSPGHFQEKNSAGLSHQLKYENSYIVNKLLLKKIEWAPFKKVGELTNEGIQFIYEKIGHMQPEFYRDNA